MEVYTLFNFGSTRIVTYEGKGFTFTSNTSWETSNADEAFYIDSHYPMIDITDIKNVDTNGHNIEDTFKESTKDIALNDSENIDEDVNEYLESNPILTMLTVDELRQMALDNNVKLPQGYIKKQDLIKLIENKEK